MSRAAFALSLALATTALAGNRARPGGTLQVALVAPAAAVEPLTADAPVDALRLLLTHQLLCRVAEPGRPLSSTLRLTLPPSIEPRLVTDALQRVSSSSSPARALLAPVSGWTVNGRAVELTLKSPAPELERSLCHPAFAIPSGPFRAKGGRLEGVDEQPAGRPHLEAVVLQAADARTAERLFAQRRVQLVAGDASADDSAQLFVTALVFGPGSNGLKQAVESTTDRADLARFFVGGPAAGMTGLLPAALGGAPAAPPVTRPAPLVPARELTILFDEDAAHERSIAQRLQVKLQPLGYRLALKATPRAQLRGRQPLDGELLVQSFALPPTATGALLVWLELAGQRARIPAVLQQLGAAPEPEARARELATQLATELAVVPLVTRGLGVTAAREVQNLKRDVLGLPRLDDVFLSSE
ncbi:MAG: peptide ABC transporter substrate-binding protein [Myxococcota bacterium]